MEIRSDHRYRFPAAPDDVWAAFAEVGSYPHWWPWLRRFEARALAAGDAWRCTIRPPLPYSLRCTIALTLVERPNLVTARVSGDIAGQASLSLMPAATDGVRPGTEVHISSALAARSLPARVGARALPRVALWGHDWVFDSAARQFGDAHGWPPAPAPRGQRAPMNSSRMPRPMMNRPPKP